MHGSVETVTASDPCQLGGMGSADLDVEMATAPGSGARNRHKQLASVTPEQIGAEPGRTVIGRGSRAPQTLVLFTILLLLNPLLLSAQVSSPFTLQIRGKTTLCGLSGSKYVPITRLSSGTLLTAAKRLRTVRAKLSRAKGATQRKLKREERALTATISRGRTPCRAGPNQPGAVPLIQPTPTPTPSPDFGCFLPGNNTTPGCFGIPAPLSGNIERGQSFYQANCRACHIAVKNNRTWNQVSVAFSNIPQMSPFRPDDQTIADIVAYLNRFNY